jgi:dTDP-4-dehydrorhamnose reductase/RimJ/RimL family protein N-acetyltransferase
MIKYIVFGDGLLGTEIVSNTGWDYISRKKNNLDFGKDEDFQKYLEMAKNYDTIVNCIAFTKTYSEDKETNWLINFKRVVELSDWCKANGKKLIHFSTNYVYCGSKESPSEDDIPVHCRTWYGYTKLLGDSYVQLNPNSLVIRTSYKSNPFPYDKAIMTQVGNFDYVDVICKLIIILIINNVLGVYNVGTDIKTMYELAIKTKPDIEKMYLLPMKEMPQNITFDISKMNKVRYKMISVTDDLLELEHLRDIRNNCREFMTNNTDTISKDAQIEWFSNLTPTKKPFLFSEDEFIIGYGFINIVDGVSILSGGLIEKYRNKGLGKILFKTLIDMCDTDKVDLEVLKSNHRAYKTYNKLGFVTYSEDNEKYSMRLVR